MHKLPKSLPKVQHYRRFVSKNKIARIFVIARKQLLTEIIEIELIHRGYQVEVFHDGMRAAIALRQKEPDLIVFDWSISFFSGFDIYYCLRSTHNYIPIVALTEAKDTRERIAILDAGADDCLSQPFAIEEFLAIVSARLRQNRKEKPSILIFEDLKLNSLTREVHRNNHSITLTAKEFNLLEYLMIHPRQVLTRVQILEKIWGYDFFGDSNVIEVYIRYLRIKLESQNEKRLIHTVRSVGYVLRSK